MRILILCSCIEHYSLIKSVSICDATYAVMAVERILKAAWWTVSPQDLRLSLQFEEMNPWTLKSSVN